MRAMHEAQLHEKNAYVTLTLDDHAIPDGNSLDHKQFKLFLRRAVKHFKTPIRYYMAGEYGEQFGRPHYHAILFGIDFDDKIFYRKNHQGDSLFTSATLTHLWKHGHASVGAVTFQSAAYVARYVMKKITGDLATTHYTWIDQDGVMHSRKPEYNQMSRRPGIGQRWYQRYKSDVYPADHVITNGHPSKTPRYYDKLLKRENPELLDQLKKKRKEKANQSWQDNTPRRLAAKEIVAEAKLRKLKRTLS